MRSRPRSALRPLVQIALLAQLLLLGRACVPPASPPPDGSAPMPGDPAPVLELPPIRPPLNEDFAAPAAQRRLRVDDRVVTDEAQLADQLEREGNAGRAAALRWLLDYRWVSLIAPGTDRRHHFANAFLVGYLPYPDVEPWVPLYTLALRKRYEFDHDQYAGAEEIWQTSREAFVSPRGDCEDHALALADWLIGLGLDARVVIGRLRGGGHAWVVINQDDRSYLLEATSKRLAPGLALPLASQMPGYQPEAMFNREQFWVNTGPKLTTDYQGQAWQLRSRFEASPPPVQGPAPGTM